MTKLQKLFHLLDERIDSYHELDKVLYFWGDRGRDTKFFASRVVDSYRNCGGIRPCHA
jgi:hypothetical protein